MNREGPGGGFITETQRPQRGKSKGVGQRGLSRVGQMRRCWWPPNSKPRPREAPKGGIHHRDTTRRSLRLRYHAEVRNQRLVLVLVVVLVLE
jgi:hypothetical protein